MREANLENSPEYSIFRIKMIEIFSKKSNDLLVKKYQDLIKEAFLWIKEIENKIVKQSNSELAENFETQKQDFVKSSLLNFYQKSSLNFYQKINVIILNTDYLPQMPQDQHHPLKILAETLVYKDVLSALDDLRFHQDYLIIKSELIDFKNTRFPIIREE